MLELVSEPDFLWLYCFRVSPESIFKNKSSSFRERNSNMRLISMKEAFTIILSVFIDKTLMLFLVMLVDSQ